MDPVFRFTNRSTPIFMFLLFKEDNVPALGVYTLETNNNDNIIIPLSLWTTISD
jgi:hypothetical protein